MSLQWQKSSVKWFAVGSASKKQVLDISAGRVAAAYSSKDAELDKKICAELHQQGPMAASFARLEPA
uniref:Uncharacterized protein n=1 Tax=Ditylenchus dipsaci TaxID=166011 RepID=A0A915E025_9BILA